MKVIGTVFFLLMSWSGCLVVAEPLPANLKNVGIQERIGAQVPGDAFFYNQFGKKIVLRDLFKSKKPVVLNLVYFGCPMLCNLVVSGFVDGIEKMPLQLGKKFDVMTISIDPTDTPSRAKSYAQKYIPKLHHHQNPSNHWQFLVGDVANIRKVTQAVGFKAAYLPDKKEYAHAAGLFFLTPKGRLARVLYGVEFKPFDLKMALIEAANSEMVTSVDTLLLFCYAYNDHSRGYSLMAERMMRVGACGMVFLLAGSVFFMFKKNSMVGN